MNYDEVYAENPSYFGNPFPEVIEYFSRQSERGSVLDVGCGQGRNAILLAEMGYQVHAIDISEVAINQLKNKVKLKNIGLKAEVREMGMVSRLEQFDYVLLDGFFHFHEHKMDEEVKMMSRLLATVKVGCKLIFCFADRDESMTAFRKLTSKCKAIEEANIHYEHIDPVSEWKFETNYFFAVCIVNQ